ncbi:unnamed protein product [Hydatigera taeniaeformis]|uniref:RRM domain-containing protein n=1 Tax=Hydatigena taeniaeformis TaxID=6205 RepID=A0A0R3WZV1_HYDTA|nr:unnamed protein product [Hydatigera taeniaeformis]
MAESIRENRRSLITTCSACQHPAPFLHDCQHCQLSICSSCCASHYRKVAVSVQKLTCDLLKKKRKLEAIRNSLKAKFLHQESHLRDGIEEAVLRLKDASDRSLDLSTANLAAFFTAHQNELSALKEAIINIEERIAKCSHEEMPIPNTMGSLLDLKEELSCMKANTKIVLGEATKCEEPKLRVDHSIGLSRALETLSLIITTDQEDEDTEISCQDEVSEASSVIGPASTGRQVFVGGVPGKVDYKQLKEYFSRYGSVKNTFISHRKGFACITFESEESVPKALSQRFQVICGARMEVKEYIKKNCATSKAEVPIVASSSPPLVELEKVYIGGIPADTTRAALESELSRFGSVKKLDMVPHRGFGVVVFNDPQTTALAISKRYLDVDSKRVELLPFVPDKKARAASVLNTCDFFSSLRRSASHAATETANISSSPSTAEISPLEAQAKVFVGGVSCKTTMNSLASALSKLGPIKRVDIFQKKGFAIVVFERSVTADLAIFIHWYMVDDKMVELLPFVPNKKFEKSSDEHESSPVGNTESVDGASFVISLLVTFALDSTVLAVCQSTPDLVIIRNNLGIERACVLTFPISSSHPNRQRGGAVFAKPQNIQEVPKVKAQHLNGQEPVLIPPCSAKHKARLVFRSIKPAGWLGMQFSITPLFWLCSHSGLAHTSAVSSIVNARKLIIRGAGNGTTHANLRDYFHNYGPVDYVNVTGTEAWVVFKNEKTVNLVLATQPHFIRGRQIALSRPYGGGGSLLG